MEPRGGARLPPILPADSIAVHEWIGDGTTATVFRGDWGGHPVAVKRINCRSDLLRGKGRVNLERELKILQSVAHDNLTVFYGVTVSGSMINIIAELCSGGTVFDLLYEDDESLVHNDDESLVLSWRQKLKMSIDVASAMRYLHAAEPPILHRDLKSLNLLLKEPVTSSRDVPLVKVADFGSSRMVELTCPDLEADVHMTADVGTPQWRAPEVFESDTYDEKADVYSYSMSLYEIIFERIPFEEVSCKTKLCIRVLRGQRPRMYDLPPECPEELVQLMVRCWSPEPSARPSFEEVCTALAAIVL